MPSNYRSAGPPDCELTSQDSRASAAGPQGSAALLPSSSRLGLSEETAAGPSGSAAPPARIDTRVFSTSRLECDHGYTAKPGVVLGMRFELPQVLRYTGRDVDCWGAVYGVWSPNSTQQPFFPGRMKAGFFSLYPQDLSQRRFDGQPGCFDPLEVPQYDMEDRDWLPFVRRPSTIRASEICAVGVRSVCVEWTKGRKDGDRANAQFVDALRRWGEREINFSMD
ncbi:hypothetical protein B0H14DRAFT_3864239 [Mycena olivaceomarginata]|nr:hypothetical protein B0H14DRAFT_3864239 [Mycena olivaceomarginata]